jgi:hypothetical protein
MLLLFIRVLLHNHQIGSQEPSTPRTISRISYRHSAVAANSRESGYLPTIAYKPKAACKSAMQKPDKTGCTSLISQENKNVFADNKFKVHTVTANQVEDSNAIWVSR